MNDYAAALKKQILQSMDITSEETAIFIDVAQRTAAISGINLSEFFEIIAGFAGLLKTLSRWFRTRRKA